MDQSCDDRRRAQATSSALWKKSLPTTPKAKCTSSGIISISHYDGARGSLERAFNRRHGDRFILRATLQNTPHGSTRSELFFSILQRQCLRDASFCSVGELRAAVLEPFIVASGTDESWPIPSGGLVHRLSDYNLASSSKKGFLKMSYENPQALLDESNPTDQQAQQLCDAIHSLGDYEHVSVRADERPSEHLHRRMHGPVARFSPLGGGEYLCLSFRKHTGPLGTYASFAGDIYALAHDLVTTTRPTSPKMSRFYRQEKRVRALVRLLRGGSASPTINTTIRAFAQIAAKPLVRELRSPVGHPPRRLSCRVVPGARLRVKSAFLTAASSSS